MRIRILIGLIYWLIICNFIQGRTPCGCVDWNYDLLLTDMQMPEAVAPRVGAWIETIGSDKMVGIIKGRTPCGCVDWNSLWIKLSAFVNTVAPRVGAWIETFLLGSYKLIEACRTPCGCVDWNFCKGCLIVYLRGSRTPCGCVDWNKSGIFE